jgi:DNA-directed RNA polymerase subunit RPC12/RpoP
VYEYKCPKCKTVQGFLLKPNFDLPKDVYRDHLYCPICLKSGHKITLKPKKQKAKVKFGGKWSDYL